MGAIVERWLNQAGGDLGESKDPWASAFIWVRVRYTSKKCEGILLVDLNITRSQSGEDKKRNLW